MELRAGIKKTKVLVQHKYVWGGHHCKKGHLHLTLKGGGTKSRVLKQILTDVMGFCAGCFQEYSFPSEE